MKRALQDSASKGAAVAATSGGCGGEEKAKMFMMMPEDAGDDELLAALGYKVRTSSMADVAQKLEQLEMAMSMSTGDGAASTYFGHSSAVMDENSIVSHLASETVHYNPSDLSNWLEKMLSELNIPPPPPPPAAPPEISLPSSAGVGAGKFVDDLSAIIPGGPEMKRLKPNPPCTSATAVVASPQPQPGGLPSTVVVLESQEAGVQLVHALLACAEAVQQGNLPAAKALVEHIGVLSLSTAGAMRKVATFFAEALARRIYNLRATPPPPAAISASELHFYESCPYLKFAHFTANQAILEAFSGKDKVHVIDFSINHGLQWPALLQALSLRPGGPPSFKLTAVGSSSVQDIGEQLAQLAETVRVKFEYRPLIAKSLADLESYMLDIEEDEAVAVNSVFELHKLLNRPGSLEKVFGLVRALKPSIVAVVEEEANHNGPAFLERFTEALHYYSSMFDSVESSSGGDVMMSEVYLGGQICNIVACEGAERVERHETAEQWRRRMVAAGFDSVALGSNAFKQASMLLEYFEGGDGYRVDEKDGCLMLGWHTRPLITTSAWRVAPPLPKRANPM